MGTHPIFESDFDCLTARQMAQLADSVWLNRSFYEQSMDAFQVFKATGKVSVVKLADVDMERVEQIESENKQLKKQIAEILKRLEAVEGRLSDQTFSSPAAAKEEDSDVDLFGSDEEDDAEAERIKAERIAAYNERKAAKEDKKGKVVAKSNIIFDIKPWDDETDLGEMEKLVRAIEMDGLLWGTAKLVAVGYGIKKLQITCVIEDDKVSTDDLEEQITANEDHVQSVDIVAFNKI